MKGHIFIKGNGLGKVRASLKAKLTGEENILK
jgi:hypothetical protein